MGEVSYLNRLCVCGCGGRVAKEGNRYIFGHQVGRRSFELREYERLYSLGLSSDVYSKEVCFKGTLSKVLLDVYARRIDKIVKGEY